MKFISIDHLFVIGFACAMGFAFSAVYDLRALDWVLIYGDVLANHRAAMS